MKWREKLIIKPDSSIYIKDEESNFVESPVRTITADEMKKLRPNARPQVRTDFLFRRGTSLHVDLDIGTFLVKKFPSIYAIDHDSGKRVALDDELDDLKSNEILSLWLKYNTLAGKEGFPKKSRTGTTAKKKQDIRSFRALGIEIGKPSLILPYEGRLDEK